VRTARWEGRNTLMRGKRGAAGEEGFKKKQKSNRLKGEKNRGGERYGD